MPNGFCYFFLLLLCMHFEMSSDNAIETSRYCKDFLSMLNQHLMYNFC